MRRLLLLVAGALVAVVAAVAALDRIVDPSNEYYSGAPLTEALRTGCELGDDLFGERSYVAFKQDLVRRRQPTTVLVGSSRVLGFGPNGRETSFLNLGFPDLGPSGLVDVLRGLEPRSRIAVYVATELRWFDPRRADPTQSDSLVSRVRYLLSPRTLWSSLSILRRSTRLAFTGWQRGSSGHKCVVDRGSATPWWTQYGTRADLAPVPAAQSAFAFARLTALDEALTIAKRRGWRLVGFSPLEPTRAPASVWPTYRRELAALFARHGFPWLDRSEAKGFSWAHIRPRLDLAARS